MIIFIIQICYLCICGKTLVRIGSKVQYVDHMSVILFP